jgi:hypothetical protein
LSRLPDLGRVRQAARRGDPHERFDLLAAIHGRAGWHNATVNRHHSCEKVMNVLHLSL